MAAREEEYLDGADREPGEDELVDSNEEILDRSQDQLDAGYDLLDRGQREKAAASFRTALRLAKGVEAVVEAAQQGAKRAVRVSWLRDAQAIARDAERSLRRLEGDGVASVTPAPVTAPAPTPPPVPVAPAPVAAPAQAAPVVPVAAPAAAQAASLADAKPASVAGFGDLEVELRLGGRPIGRFKPSEASAEAPGAEADKPKG